MTRDGDLFLASFDFLPTLHLKLMKGRGAHRCISNNWMLWHMQMLRGKAESWGLQQSQRNIQMKVLGDIWEDCLGYVYSLPRWVWGLLVVCLSFPILPNVFGGFGKWNIYAPCTPCQSDCHYTPHRGTMLNKQESFYRAHLLGAFLQGWVNTAMVIWSIWKSRGWGVIFTRFIRQGWL